MPDPVGAIDPLPQAVPSPPSGGWWRISPLRIGVVALVVAALVIAWVLTRGPSAAYRTSLVRTGTVEATVDAVGAIAPVNQADLAFGVSGTVASVAVSVGETVTQGQTVASLDPTPLQTSVVSAQAALAVAQATLAAAEASESDTGSSPSASSPATAPAAAPSASGGAASDARQIAPLQATLVADQSEEDADATAATRSLAAATSLCDASSSPPPASGTTATTSAPTSGSTGTTSGAAGTAGTSSPAAPASGGNGTPSACAVALSQATAAQNKVSADIQQVARDESALDAALEAGSTAATGGSRTGPGGNGSPPAAAAAEAAPSGGATATLASNASTPVGSSVNRGSTEATPQQLAVDQASIDSAEARLTDAQQALDGAVLASPITGTVAAVSVSPGTSVAAASGTGHPEIVVIGPGSSYQLVTQVPVADLPEVAVGQAAVVVPDATDTRLDGTVTSIGVLPTSGSTTTDYPVTISLTSSDLGSFSGAGAAATIVVGRSTDVTTVPTSAVRTVGSLHFVTVVDGDTTRTARVTIGTVGDVLTQVTSGVKPGQLVSLANLGEPVPTTSTGASRFGGTGFGGGGLGRAGGGGFGGFGGAGGFGGR